MHRTTVVKGGRLSAIRVIARTTVVKGGRLSAIKVIATSVATTVALLLKTGNPHNHMVPRWRMSNHNFIRTTRLTHNFW